MKPRFSWDEPPGCTTPRGWCILVNHPDSRSTCISRCVGNYLDYGPTTARGPQGETVHASAYIDRSHPLTGSISPIGLGYCWFHTIGEAKQFIESNVCAYFGQKMAQVA